MGSKYRPSCGSEGVDFQLKYCDRCKDDEGYRLGVSGGCHILADTLALGKDDPKYPKEWTYNEDGQPTCTAFKEIEGFAQRKSAGEEDG